MKNTFFTLFAILLYMSTIAQISHGGQPHDWNSKAAITPDLIAMPAVDLKKMAREDSLLDQHEDIPYRFGANIPVDIDINNSGIWSTLENGDRVWRVGIKAKGALSINFVFDQYYVPEGGEIFVYDTHKKQLLGSFTNENTSQENSLGVGFIFSDEIIISYHEPAAVAGQGYLHINNVTHGYRNAFIGIEGLEKAGPFGSSGACNINVNCPEGLPYGIQKRSVALIVVNNNGHCSGALVNTTAQDETPYFLTANHCLGNVGNWVFYFNHETADCAGNGTAPTNQTVSGSSLIASNIESDFGLVLLNNDVPDSYNVCYSGWDATDNPNTVASAFGIHHPSGDVKKICFEDDAPYQTELGGFANQVWYIDQWEQGVTEGGSSGSPLFNQSGLIIGQLAGGLADCNGPINNGLYDFYGRLGVSWDFGSTPSTRLKDWLDPGNTGQVIVPNSCNSQNIINDATLVSITGIDNPACTLSGMQAFVNVINTGSEPMTSVSLELVVNGSTQNDIEWTGNVASFSSVQIPLGSISPIDGVNTVEVSVQSVNGGADEQDLGNFASLVFPAYSATQTISISIEFDDYPAETSWRIENDQGDIIISGIGSDNQSSIFEEICLGLGCYTFIIDDSASDGICCFYGEGSYLVSDESGLELASGGEFNSTEQTEFCITTVDVENAILETINIYPNPTNGITNIQFGDAANTVKSIMVTDALGRVLARETTTIQNVSNYSFNGAQYGDGIYFIAIETEFGTTTRKIIVMR